MGVILFSFTCTCVNIWLKQTCIRIFKPKSYWLKTSTFFGLVSGHQADYSINPSRSKLVLLVNLVLTLIELMFSWDSLKITEAVTLSNVFRGFQKGPLTQYGLNPNLLFEILQ